MQANLELRELIATQLGVDADEVQSEAQILDDLCADSLDVVELVMALEEAFGIEIPDQDVDALRTVGDVETYLAKRL